MSTFEITAIGIGVFSVVVGLIVALMEFWDRRTARKHKHA
jgi:hypothetical protein